MVFCLLSFGRKILKLPDLIWNRAKAMEFHLQAATKFRILAVVFLIFCQIMNDILLSGSVLSMQIYLALPGEIFRKHIFQSLGRLRCQEVAYPFESGGAYDINP